MENLHDRYAILIDTVEDQIIPVWAAANTKALIARDKRKGLWHFTKREAGSPQFRNERTGPGGIVARDIVADPFKTEPCRVRKNNLHDRPRSAAI
jgi:hypothetical protein